VKIQKNVRRHQARKTYRKLHLSVLVLQTGLRSMAAHKEFRFRKQTKAAILIQVIPFKTCITWKATFLLLSVFKNEYSLSTKMQARWRCHKAASYYKKLKRGTIVTQCRWRGRIARRELRNLKMVSIEEVFPKISYINVYMGRLCIVYAWQYPSKIIKNYKERKNTWHCTDALLMIEGNSQLCMSDSLGRGD
jgi:hypothetical protein